MFKDIINELTKSDLQSLPYLAGDRVAISICESKDVLCFFQFGIVGNSSVGISDDQWTLLIVQAKRKLNQIGVPKLCFEIILKNLWPISLEICKWIRYHDGDIDFDYSSNFVWTPHPKIDYLKTAEILVKNKALNIKKRFKLAGLYCLELEVRSLWDTMTLREKRNFYFERNLKKSVQYPIVLYWRRTMEKAPTDYYANTALHHAELFEYAVKNGYLSATKFFLGKLKIQLRNRMIENSFCLYLFKIYKHECIVRDHLAIASFLIGELSSDYEGIGDYDRLSLVYLYFLEWPFQKHFITFVNRMAIYITKGIFVELLEVIFKKCIGNFKDYDYKKLFQQFWLLSSREYRTYVNTESEVGLNMFMIFVEKHFEFDFYETSSDLNAQLRDKIFSLEPLEIGMYFDEENVQFLNFLVQKRITTKISIHEIPFFELPLEELL